MSITTQCMTVNLQIGMWNAQRLDRGASASLTADAGADADAARVNKHLINKTALKPIQTAANALRTHFYHKTLPWKDNGDRLLTRKMYLDFLQGHADLVDKFNAAVGHFVDVEYLKELERSAFRMGSLYNADDYPSAAEVRRKFYINLDVDAVTEAGDFRVALDSENLDRIKSGIESAMSQRIAAAMQDVWTRLGTILGHFADKMNSDGVFRNSTVSNLEEIVAMLPALNVTDDPELERIRQEIEEHVVGYAPDELRKDKGARDAAATEAKRIMDDMAGFMNAFGQAA